VSVETIGEAILSMDLHGKRFVEHADPIIRVSTDLLASSDLAADALEEDGTLRLDSAGEYRYRFLRAESEHVHLYKRVSS
jgi:hypothetical protein